MVKFTYKNHLLSILLFNLITNRYIIYRANYNYEI